MKSQIVSIDVDKQWKEPVVEVKIRILHPSDSYIAYLSDMLRHQEDVVILEKILTEQD